LQRNLCGVDFSKLLLDVVTIADEVDSQLKQAMFSYVMPITLNSPAFDLAGPHRALNHICAGRTVAEDWSERPWFWSEPTVEL
jgi:hypothetical protein